MNKLRRTGAVAALVLTLAVSAFGGIIHSTGAVAPPPPPSEQASVANNESAQPNMFDAYQSGDATTSITTTVILTLLNLVR